MKRIQDHHRARIVLVVPSFPKLSESFVVSKFLGLLDLGWDVHIVCGESKSEEWSHFPELEQRLQKAKRIHVNFPHRPVWVAALFVPLAMLFMLAKSPGETLKYLRLGWSRFGLGVIRRLYLDARLIALQPDLIHFEFGALAVGRRYLKSLLSCRATASFRGYDLNYSGLESDDYYKQVWEELDGLHFLGHDLWNKAKLRGCPSHKSHAFIPPGIDEAFFPAMERTHTEVAGDECRPLRILSIGRLEWCKGYDYAIQAVRISMDHGIKCEYRIIGNGDCLEAVAFARHQLGLDNIIELMGAQPRSEVFANLLWADVLLHTATSEGFCNAVLEGQAMGLPVVCTDAGGLPENVADGETGYVVRRRCPDAIAEKLLVLARNPILRDRMGRAGRRRVLQQFSFIDHVERFDQFFNRVLASDADLSSPASEPRFFDQSAFEKR